jgi:hypothetical protein
VHKTYLQRRIWPSRLPQRRCKMAGAVSCPACGPPSGESTHETLCTPCPSHKSHTCSDTCSHKGALRIAIEHSCIQGALTQVFSEEVTSLVGLLLLDDVKIWLGL